MVFAHRLQCLIWVALLVIATSGFAAHPAQAGKKLVRGIAIGIGAAIIGGIIVNEMQKNNARSAPAYRPKPDRRSYVYSQRTREIQISLNSLGFEAGRPDGIMGEQTRTAIRAYQDYIGVPITGHLNDRQFAELKELSREQFANEYVAPRKAPSQRSPYSPSTLN